MKILATFLHKQQRNKGFSLLEMLIVLIILSMITGLLVPRIETLYTRSVFYIERQKILGSFASLGVTALQEGRKILLLGEYVGKNSNVQAEALSFSTDSAVTPQLSEAFYLPEQWKIQVTKALVYQANGLCRGGNLTLSYKDFSRRYTLASPYCRPEAIE